MAIPRRLPQQAQTAGPGALAPSQDLHIATLSSFEIDQIDFIAAIFSGIYRSCSDSPAGAKVETKKHHKTMKIRVPEAEILRTPIKIEKLSRWNRTLSEFIMNFEFH